jgi:putative endonuclease
MTHGHTTTNTTTATGQRAEQAAAEYLSRLGYDIIDRNWKRRDCEIDIIARKGSVMYFVEVKYRVDDYAGTGLDYITPQKLRRMAHAAERWVQLAGWRSEYSLAAIEVSGAFVVSGFLDELY